MPGIDPAQRRAEGVPGRWNHAIKAVLFDLDGTLVDHDSAVDGALAAFRARHLPDRPADDLRAAWQAATDLHFPRFVRGEISYQEQRRCRIRDVLGLTGLAEAEADRYFGSYLEAYESLCLPYRDVHQCLSALAGLPLGVVSNGETRQQRGKLRRSGLLDRFGTIVISDAAGLRKPDPRIFHLAARNLGVNPSGCAFVGDSEEADYRGAEAAGLFPILIDRGAKAEGRGWRAIASLEELPAMLGKKGPL